MFNNKALQMDPLISRLVNPITEYSATQGSSGFSSGQWPGMDIARLLLFLKQGTRLLEDYIQEYLNIAYYSDLPDCVLIDFFCEGINQPLKSQLIREGPRSSLSQFLDYALLTVGSAFTVGVAEERDTAPNCVITAALEHAHKMAATTTPRSVIAANHKPSQVPADVKGCGLTWLFNIGCGLTWLFNIGCGLTWLFNIGCGLTWLFNIGCGLTWLFNIGCGLTWLFNIGCGLTWLFNIGCGLTWL